MRADFRDIRFADKYGNELKHFRESYTEFSTAKFWVKLPANDTKILMFYGNGGVTTASSGADTFDFWDDFTSLSGSLWSIVHGSASVSNSLLSVASTTLNSIVESTTTYAPNTLMEMKAYHPATNKAIFGYRSTDSQKAAAWQGTTTGDSNYYDHPYTHNGTSGTWINDGVARGGTTFYIYGVAHITAGDKFFVNYVLRQTASSTLPGNVSLPIHFYSEANKGALVVDWVRIRKYAATEPTLTLGRKFVQNSNGFLQQHDYISDEIVTYVSTGGSIKDIFTDSVTTGVTTGFAIGQPDQITDAVSTICTMEDGPIIERTKLRDYSLISCTVSKNINDAYLQLSAEFADVKIPTRGTTVKHYGVDSIGNSYLLFWGKVISNSPSLYSFYKTNAMVAADGSRNLSVQPVPWNWQIISLEGDYNTWPLWLNALIDYEETGVGTVCVIDNGMADKQFSFDAKTTRLEAIKKICEYCGLIINIKLVTDGTLTIPGFYAVPASEIDQISGGFDLPDPIDFNDIDNISLVTQPRIVEEPDEFYNKVIVYGTITSTGETVVAAAFTPAVHLEQEKARVYPVQDNSIEEKGTTAEIEAIRWLLYFNSPRATVTATFVQRFDFELYQRIRFSGNFPAEIKRLTNSVQLQYVVCNDPRDEVNSTHIIDVSGVPTPAWLRITGIKNTSAKNEETVELTMITDYIYSSADPNIPAPYNSYISPGYRKPISNDSTTTIQDVVDNTVEKQLTPEICTVLSIDEENQTRLVQTQSGKLVTTKYG